MTLFKNCDQIIRIKIKNLNTNIFDLEPTALK